MVKGAPPELAIFSGVISVKCSVISVEFKSPPICPRTTPAGPMRVTEVEEGILRRGPGSTSRPARSSKSSSSDWIPARSNRGIDPPAMLNNSLSTSWVK